MRAQLAALTGVREVAARPIAGTIDAAIPELERDQVIRTLLEQSPELRAARAELERTRAVTARARRETYPDLFLRGGGAYNREHGEDTGRPIGWEGTLEAGVSVPLFNRNTGGIAAVARGRDAGAGRGDATGAGASVARRVPSSRTISPRFARPKHIAPRSCRALKKRIGCTSRDTARWQRRTRRCWSRSERSSKCRMSISRV